MDPERLGPYQIQKRLGSGGMGVVYLAEDTRLGRSVAVKVLPPEADPVALGRFVREARTVAALQHPHIAVLHDVGKEAGVSYLVMEKIEGETLKTILEVEPVSWKDALRYAEQLASALAHAHGLGVLHRDIKPGNIMISASRGAVLLDFGLAERASVPQITTGSAPTESMEKLTREGVVAGTLSYMSPEQIQEKELDERSDLFQLGVTLHEAVAGRHPFHGPTGVDVMHAILRVDPPPLLQVASVPEELSRIVGKLLEKEREYRYPDARALEVDLRGLERSSSSGVVSVAGVDVSRQRPLPRRSRQMPMLAALLGLVAVAVAGLGWWATRPELSAVPRRLVPLTHGEGNARGPSFSPDGNSVVYSSDRGGQWDLWVGLVAGGPPVQITDTTEYEGQPSWSPDGSRVVFTRGRFGEGRPGAFVMPALGGDARRIVENALDPAWSPDGRWIAYASASEGWARISKISVEAGGDPVPVTPLEEGFFHRSPGWSPDGRTIVFNRSPGGQAGQLMRVASSGGTADPITRDPEGTANLSARVTPDGRYVVHVSDRGGALNLWRIPLKGGALERITSGPGQDLSPAVSSDGTKIVFVNSPVATRILAVSYPESEVREIALLEGSEAWGPNVSPDGSQIVLSRKVPGRSWEMVLIQRDTRAMRSVLEGLPDVFWGRFHPDGQSLLFHAQHAAGSRIGRVGLDGTGLAWLTPAGEDNAYPSVPASGERITFVRGGSDGADIVVRRLPDDGEERVVARNATLPSFSPDGSRIAFARSRSYAGGVGVVDLEGGEPRWLTTTGTWPTWLPDGSGIAFADVGREGSQMAFVVSPDDGERRLLGSFHWGGTHWPFVLPGPHELITTDGTGEKTTLWLAEY